MIVRRAASRREASAWRVRARTPKRSAGAEPSHAAQVTIGEEPAQRKRDREGGGPERPGDAPDDPGLEAPEERKGDDGGQEACRRVARLLVGEAPGDEARHVVRQEVDRGAIGEERQARGGLPGMPDARRPSRGPRGACARPGRAPGRRPAWRGTRRPGARCARRARARGPRSGRRHRRSTATAGRCRSACLRAPAPPEARGRGRRGRAPRRRERGPRGRGGSRGRSRPPSPSGSPW